jgi:tetratricopeptide (TPR) repeat protein
MADKYYQQGLDYARQTKARTVEMRATLSLASLRVQSGRPREAVDLIQRVLPYYEQGNFLRERAQALTLLGGAQDQLGRREAEQTLRKAVDASGKLGDAEQSGIAHGYLAVALADRGNLPAALQQEEQSLQALGDLRGGLSAAFAYAEQARIQSQAGLFDKAAESLAGAETRLARLQGRQTQLRAAILNARAQLFYTQRKWAEASQAARQAQALPQNEDDPDARCLIGLTDIWTGNLASGLKEANAAIGLYEQKELMVSAAAARLMLAQALAENQHAMDARPFARASLDAFQSLENWDATWRCRRILQDPAASEALERCRQALGPDLFESYRKRPDLRNLN